MQTFGSLHSTAQKEIKKEVCIMLANGLGYKKIIKKLKEKEISISKGTLYYWCNKETQRFRKNSFTPIPTKELSYFIGVMFGDGCATRDEINYDYSLRLDSIDKEFVEKFAFCISKLLKKENVYPVHKCKHIFSANIRSKELYEFVNEIKTDFNKAKPLIEENPTEFIQGLADSEGCPSISANSFFYISIVVANSTNYPLLKYAQTLLANCFGIDSKIRKTKFIGMTDSIIENRLIKRTKDLFILKINKFEDVKKYSNKINFSIIRKHQKLNDGVKIKELFNKNEQQKEWKKIYLKDPKQWKKISTTTPSPGFGPGSHP